MGRHHPLVSVAVEHGFFTEGGCRDLVFEPTRETTASVSRLALLARPTPNGVALFFEEDRVDGLRMRASESEPLWLAWRVTSRDRAFENYTTPSIRMFPSKVLFFSNLSRPEPAPGDATVYLHERESVTAADFRDWDVLTADTMPVGLGTWRDRKLPPHFVVGIRIGVPELGRALAETTGGQYGIRFDARETVWKYYVLGLGPKVASYVADADSRLEFLTGVEESLAGGRKARVFRSGTPIALRDRFELKLQLRESSTGNGKVLVRRLPVATADQIYTEVVQGDETVVSEIYVNC